MKRIFLIFSVLLICLALAVPSFAQRDGRGGPKDRVWRSMTATPAVTDDASLGYRIGDEWHYGGRIWITTDPTIGAAVWDEQPSSSGPLSISSGVVTIDSTYFDVDVGGLTTYGTSGNSTWSVDGAGNVVVAGNVGINTTSPNANVKLDVAGTSLANESLGGVSTYVIDGDLDMTTLASATAALLTAGRIIEINATASSTVRLSDMTSLSSVTNDMLFVDITLAGNPSGVTVWSPTNKLVSGLGATFTTGDTIFINGGASGNTGYTLTCKALNYGSSVSPYWRVWTDADVIRRP